MNPKLQSLYGLKFNPFRPDIPVEALYVSPAVDAFLRRVELGIADGGYIMITGDPGTGKSVVLRLLTHRLQSLRDVVVGTIEHPQSRTMDFYRELGDLFAVPFGSHNRWGGFKALRSRWADHIASTLTRPVLIIDSCGVPGNVESTESTLSCVLTWGLGHSPLLHITRAARPRDRAADGADPRRSRCSPSCSHGPMHG